MDSHSRGVSPGAEVRRCDEGSRPRIGVEADPSRDNDYLVTHSIPLPHLTQPPNPLPSNSCNINPSRTRLLSLAHQHASAVSNTRAAR